MLIIVTTSKCLTEKLAVTANSTNRPEASRHLITYSSRAGLPEAEFRRRCLRHVELQFVEGCSIAAGFNHCLLWAGDEAAILVLNEGDLMTDCSRALATLLTDPACDAVVGRWTEEGVIRSPKRAITFENILRHGMGFNHSACIVRPGFHLRFGAYPERYKICMDYALFLVALDQGARFRLVEDVMAEIEKPGVSSQIFARSAEHREIIEPFLGPLRSRFLWGKWIVNAHIGLVLRKLGWKSIGA